MPRTAPWYRGCFILVSMHQHYEGGGYWHPLLQVRRRHERPAWSALPSTPAPAPTSGDPRLPAQLTLDGLTADSEPLLQIRFQAHRTDVGGSRDMPAQPWLDPVGGDSPAVSHTYGGRVETDLRVEQWGVRLGDFGKRLQSVDKALRRYRERVKELGGSSVPCDLTVLMLALKSSWKLPVVFVCYRPGSLEPVIVQQPEPHVSTAARIARLVQREQANTNP